jgi:hypothetical protein
LLVKGLGLELKEWLSWYRHIVEALGLDKEADRRATLKLANLIREKAVKPGEIAQKVSGKTVIVFGAGPSLQLDLARILKAKLQKFFVPVAADGAATALLKSGITPALIVSDLDGRVSDFVKAEGEGSIIVVHAHGDNVDALEKWIPRFNRVLGTTQTEPIEGLVYNFGGFTDGDRAVFLVEALGAERIFLAGMDLGETVGKYSKPRLKRNIKADFRKRIKLEIAGRLLAWLAAWSETEILNFTYRGENIKGIRKISLKELRKLLKGEKLVD